MGTGVYAAGTLMFPDERGEQDDRTVRIAKTHGVWVALGQLRRGDRWRLRHAGRQFGDLGS
ncbi:MAG: hypothetical protein ACR2MP_12620 [Streptosporangiaceae bacterium]